MLEILLARWEFLATTYSACNMPMTTLKSKQVIKAKLKMDDIDGLEIAIALNVESIGVISIGESLKSSAGFGHVAALETVMHKLLVAV